MRVEYSALNISTHSDKLKTIFASHPLMLVMVMVVTITIGGCSSQQPGRSQAIPILSPPPNAGYSMPPLNADSVMGWVMNDGQPARIADYHGKVLVLDLFATWCVPCRESIPRLNALQQKYETKGLQIVGLNVGGPDDRVKVAAFAKELKIQYPIGFPDKSFNDLVFSSDQEIPQTLLFSHEGQLKARFLGYEDSTGDDLEKQIIELVKTED